MSLADTKEVPTFAEVLEAIDHVVHTARPGAARRRAEADLGRSGPDRAATTKHIRRELLRGRCPRPCRSLVERDRDGRTRRYATPEDLFEKVIHRVIERRLRTCIMPHLPRESVGLAEGTSVQLANQGIANYVKTNRDDHVARGDVSGCHESIRPFLAIRAVEALGLDPWTSRWLRALYKRNRGIVHGLGRGLAFASLLASAVLLPVFRRLRSIADHVVWVGDDMLALVADAETAEKAWAEFAAGLAELKLAPARDKKYVGPIAGRWSFGGLVYDQGRVAPKPKKVRKLETDLAARLPDQAKLAREGVVGWCQQYIPAFISSEVIQANNRIREAFPKQVPDLVATMATAAARTQAWRVPLPGFPAGESLRLGRGDTSPFAYESPQDSRSPSRAVTAAAASQTPPRGAGQFSGSVPEALLDSVNPMDLYVHPERLPVFPPGGLMRLAGRSFSDFMFFAEAVEKSLRSKAYKSIGWQGANEFVKGQLGTSFADVLRLIEIRREVEIAFDWWSGEHDDEVDPPVAYLKAIFRLTSPLRWARVQRMHLIHLVAEGRVSVRQVKRAVRTTEWRRRRALKTTRKYRRQHKWQAYWWVHTRDGRVLVGRGLDIDEFDPKKSPPKDFWF